MLIPMRTTLAPLLLALLATPALADRVKLRSGRVVEGEVREEGEWVIVRTGSGIEARLPRAEVLEVERAATPEQELAARRAALAQDDLRGHLALVEWCEARGLRGRARELREAILVRWPDEPRTRRELGFVRHEERWITRQEYMRSLALVPSEDGTSWITPEDAEAQAALEEARRRAPEVRGLVRRAADPQAADAAAVKSELAAVDDLAAIPVLVEALGSETPATRVLAAQELGRRKSASAAPALARAAIEDPRRAGREAALDALQGIAATPGGGLSAARAERYFVRAFAREHDFQRVHAVEAAARFPSRDAVPGLIVLLRESTGGFGRVHISIETQRAYIEDFELVSGGTGLTVAEVADPKVGTLVEGTQLDTKVIQWERRVVLKVLRGLTGQGFGGDPGEWERWWLEQGGSFQLPR